jgi:hypothetical protein
VENKAAGAPLHKFIGAFRFGLKAALNRATVEGEFGTLAGEQCLGCVVSPCLASCLDEIPAVL